MATLAYCIHALQFYYEGVDIISLCIFPSQSATSRSVIAGISRVTLRVETYSEGRCEQAELEPYWGLQTRVQSETITSVKAALQKLNMEETHEYIDTSTNQPVSCLSKFIPL